MSRTPTLLLSALFAAALVGCTGEGQLTDAAAAPPVVCAPADRVCRDDAALVCSLDGTAWEVEPCDADEVCLDGACQPPLLAIVTDYLPAAEVGLAYDEVLEASGGTLPYDWSLGTGDLPPGLDLEDHGSLSGVPEAPGDYVFEVAVDDAEGEGDSHAYALTVHPEPLAITTPADLGHFDEGVPMSVPLEAVGGVAPYGWFLLEGDLPAGLTIDASGAVGGVPTEAGAFSFVMRVVDAQEPPGYGEQEFSLHVDLRPLDIIGEQELDLLGVEVVTLPLLTIVPGIPLPYETQLQATGGLVPYTWTELDLPPLLETFITQDGIPSGLTLEEDGVLTGAVTATDEVVTLEIPFTSIALTGFFFFAEVADSQSPSETDQALFLIPTLPVEL